MTQRPADWPKAVPGVKLGDHNIQTFRDQWTWRPLAKVSDLTPSDTHATFVVLIQSIPMSAQNVVYSSAAVKYGDSQLAIFHVPKKGYYATQQVIVTGS
jgi:nitrite reductase (NAD(P)H)